MSSDCYIIVIGGGLAGSEAAYHAAEYGVSVVLYEMRPATKTEAHRTANLGELVCSNSLKSDSTDNASGILKHEMRALRSLVLEAADHSKVPAGKALAVDRSTFSQYITNKVRSHPRIQVIEQEITQIPDDPGVPFIVATGPLTSAEMTESIKNLTGSTHLYFYDSISPIIDGDTIDHDKVFTASRYGRGDQDEGDYINCPLNKDQYTKLVTEILDAEKIEIRDFEKGIYFESCLPIEVMIERGVDTLRFGPAKPVGLVDPGTGQMPYAVIQLRKENLEGTMYNIVGFQTKLKYPEQKRVFRMIPGLESVEIMRYGSVHRNTYINSPKHLLRTLQMKNRPHIFFAGQITGVEGYVESSATGIVAGINAAKLVKGHSLFTPPRDTAVGALLKYITDETIKDFQPMNINFGLFPPPNKKTSKSKRRELIAERALSQSQEFVKALEG